MTERKIKNTDRIYERDSSVSDFEATVLWCDGADGEYKAVLDRTAFFPTGGGQSCDGGTLNGISVTDVRIEDGEIIHILASPVSSGGTVHGVIDFTEREEKMRSHTAEHILSSVLNKKYGLSNVGFHLGSIDTTCDFDGVLTPGQLNDAEDEVNRIIRENHVVYPVFPSESDLKALDYRSKLELTKDVRIVMIGEDGSVDKCACCAPHVSETGKIGLFKIVDAYKYKGGTRVHILTGQKALERAREDFEGIKALSVLLSVKPNGGGVISAVTRLTDDLKLQKAEINALNERINSLIVDSLAKTSPAVIFDDRTDAQALRSLCLSALDKVDTAAVFGGESGKYTFVIAGKNASEAFTKIKKSLNVRGGGKEVICGTAFATESEIHELFNGEKNMKPILLTPILKNYIWGGARLKTEYGFVSDEEKVAEAWMLSSHKDGRNIDAEMPILVKLIDARDKLSVQVHPNDEYAYRVENEPGKTEMWYIVDCEDGARLIYGFKKEITKEEFERRIRDNTLDEVMNYVPVHKGDVFFIPSGTLHAIGAGILIAEIQQSSNTTYRVSDYGRLGADGKPRQLHIEKALDVTKTVLPTVPYGQIGEITEYPFGKVRTLSECEYFSAYELVLDGSFEITPKNFLHILVLDGEITVGDIKTGKGGSVYLPANCQTAVEGKATFLVSTV